MAAGAGALDRRAFGRQITTSTCWFSAKALPCRVWQPLQWQA
jgi:hypothetical protein